MIGDNNIDEEDPNHLESKGTQTAGCKRGYGSNTELRVAGQRV